MTSMDVDPSVQPPQEPPPQQVAGYQQEMTVPRQEPQQAPQQPSPPQGLWQPSPGVNPATALQPPRREEQAAPPGAPPPPPQPTPPPRGYNFQRYTPSTPQPPGYWGKPNWAIRSAKHYPSIRDTPFFPSDREAINVIRGAAGQLGRFAAPGVAGPMNVAASLASIIGPFFDYFSNNAFSAAYRSQALGGARIQEQQMRMQEQQMDMNRQNMVNALQQGNAAHQDMLTSYGEVYERLRLKDITEDEAKDQIKRLNARYNHQYLDHILDNVGLGGVQQYLAWEHSRFIDTMSAYTSLTTPSKQKAGKPPVDYPMDDIISGQPGATAAGAPAAGGALGPPEAGEDTGAGATGAATPSPVTAGSEDDSVARQAGLPDAGKADAMRMAHDLLNTGKVGNLTAEQFVKQSPHFGPRVIAASEDLKNRISDVANGQGTPDEKIANIAKVDKDTANTLSGLTKYQINPVSMGAERKHLVGLAEAVSGGKYKEDFYDVNKKMSDIGSQTGREVMRINMMGQGALTVMNALKDIPENEAIPRRQLELMLADRWSGDPKYTNLYHALNTFAIEVGGVASGTGTARVSIINNVLAHAKATSSPAQIRGALLAEMQTGQAGINYINDYWREQTGTSTYAPLLRGHGIQNFESILHMNPDTGEMPEKSSPEVMSVSKPGGGKSWTPLPTPIRNDLRDYVEANRDNPNPAVQDRVRRAIDQLGINP